MGGSCDKPAAKAVVGVLALKAGATISEKTFGTGESKQSNPTEQLKNN